MRALRGRGHARCFAYLPSTDEAPGPGAENTVGQREQRNKLKLSQKGRLPPIADAKRGLRTRTFWRASRQKWGAAAARMTA